MGVNVQFFYGLVAEGVHGVLVETNSRPVVQKMELGAVENLTEKCEKSFFCHLPKYPCVQNFDEI